MHDRAAYFILTSITLGDVQSLDIIFYEKNRKCVLGPTSCEVRSRIESCD